MRSPGWQHWSRIQSQTISDQLIIWDQSRNLAVMATIYLSLFLEQLVVVGQLPPVRELLHDVEEPLAHPPREVDELLAAAVRNRATLSCWNGRTRTEVQR